MNKRLSDGVSWRQFAEEANKAIAQINEADPNQFS